MFESRCEFSVPIKFSHFANLQKVSFVLQTRSHDENHYRFSKQHLISVFLKNLKNRFFDWAKAPIIDDRKLVRICAFLNVFCLSWLSLTGKGYADSELIDLEEMAQDFVLETKKIEIPGYPFAFNPSIIRWQGRLIMSFRVIDDPKASFNSWIGLIFLDDNFNPIGEPQKLIMRPADSTVPCRAEDARFLIAGDRLWMIYSDNAEPKISRGGYRVYIATVIETDGHFSLEGIECLSRFEGENQNFREKNWVPFEYEGQLLLAYSLKPHRIFIPMAETGECWTVATTPTLVDWAWGDLRGGTPAIFDENIGEYLAFFHSSKNMATVHSDGAVVSHYFIGAYTFSRHPPFNITRISQEPIVGRGFYRGTIYKPYWKPVRVVFPCGIIVEQDYIWITYGRQDHEIWITKLDKKRLLNHLTPVKLPKENHDRPTMYAKSPRDTK